MQIMTNAMLWITIVLTDLFSALGETLIFETVILIDAKHESREDAQIADILDTQLLPSSRDFFSFKKCEHNLVLRKET